MTNSTPRIALIHALRDSVVPAMDAMARGWPQAKATNLVDDSLSADLARDGRLTPAMTDRFVALARYAVAAGADGILFTCSAFGPAIEAAGGAVAIPVLKPNESAFAQALAAGPRIGVLVTFTGSLPALQAELHTMAAGRRLDVHARLVPRALAALQAGDGASHDEAIAADAANLPACDAIVLGQFSMARARAAVAARVACPVLTTPDAAVAELRRRVAA
ncbi:MAG: arylsulfatase [Proteobacteria bacterium]|nr:arylsulfatase [Pseudomonadota bacterium]